MSYEIDDSPEDPSLTIESSICIVTHIEASARFFISEPLEAVCRDLNMLFSNILMEAVRLGDLPSSDSSEIKDLLSLESNRVRYLSVLEMPLQASVAGTALAGFQVTVDWSSPDSFVLRVAAPEALSEREAKKVASKRVLH